MKILFTFYLAVTLYFAVYSVSLAHNMMGAGDFEMMQNLEKQSIGNEQTYKEMENLMDKMMEGNLTASETERLSSFMKEYPGPFSTMMTRMMNGNLNAVCPGATYSGYYNMMMPYASSWGGFWWWLILSVLAVVWILVGIVKIQKLLKDDKNKDK